MKAKKKLGWFVGTPWTPAEVDILHRDFSDSSNAALAEQLGRTVKSVIYRAAALGLRKSAERLSERSRTTALAVGRTSADMAAIGSKGGRLGGLARANALTPEKRVKIAKAAIKARWEKPGQ